MALLRGIAPRGNSIESSPAGSGYSLSRRSFLALSGAGVAIGAMPRFLRGEGFDIVRDEHRIHVLVAGIRRWTIDPSLFGEEARLDVDQRKEGLALRLSRAFFPATRLPADFTCNFRKESGGTWMLRIKMECGLDVSSPLLDWLLRRNPASGSLTASHLAPFDELGIEFEGIPAAFFNPDWTLAISGHSTITVRGLNKVLPSSGLEILLNSDSVLAGSPAARSTTFVAVPPNPQVEPDPVPGSDG